MVHKLLGLYYDSPHLKWKAHTDYLIVDCMRRVDIMKAVSSPNFGASSKVLRQFYLAYIRAKLNYGSVLYSSATSASKCNLEWLEKIQNACCRMILGARRSTPIISLQAEAHIPSLELQRGFLAVKTLTKLSYKPKSKSSVDNLSASNNEYTENLCPVNSFMRSIFWCKILGIYIKRVHDDIVCDVPPWEVNAQIITSYDESQVYNNQTFLNYIDAEYRHFKSCFTDGSKIIGDNPVVDNAIYFPHGRVGCTYHLHPSESVIFSELFAIKLVLEFIEQHPNKLM